MPCYNGPWEGPSYPVETKVNGLDVHQLSAILCGFVTALARSDATSEVMNLVNWDEIGITEDQFKKWWKKHQERDRKRLEKALAAEQLQMRREAALAKLTPEDRKALGL